MPSIRDAGRAAGHLFAGLASYAQNNLFAAREHFQEVLTARGHVGTAASVDSILGLALTCQALGDEDRARTLLVELAVLIDDTGAGGPSTLLRSFQARLALTRGDLEEAGRQLDMARDDAVVAHLSYVETPEITRARWLLLQGVPTALDEVATIVDGLRQQASVRRHALGMFRAELVRALLFQARGGDAVAAFSRMPRTMCGPSDDVGATIIEMNLLLQVRRSAHMAPDGRLQYAEIHVTDDFICIFAS